MSFEKPTTEEQAKAQFESMSIADIREWALKATSYIGKEVQGVTYGESAIPAKNELLEAIDTYYDVAEKVGTAEALPEGSLDSALDTVREKAASFLDATAALEDERNALTEQMKKQAGFE